ncbi:hypothetical protein GCM10018785_07920 [Streptomyces longispororuber]|uniref:Uncharacterized protein n=1 Tax=Streptomyces longispororuber TaxID=68230 RepID=A0A918Z8B9_9ACTN|nr:hypothetical protein [Streptomyces longispororuber]GHE40800.1 hypothetical protein GCM10018785_07920 [Streptomyces longispororuber]
MTGVSRRALLGYSGSAAAGAALASAGTARAADGAPAEAAEATEGNGAAEAQTIDYADGTEFRGTTSIGDIDAMMEMSFRIKIDNAPAAKQITPLEIAEALNKIGASRGWPKVTFYYTTSAPLN